jgi:hypothetical protein
MEAATPLRKSPVEVLPDRLVVDGLVVEDECAVRVVREREQAGDDPAKTLTDAIEIGSRVLDREQAAANAEYVRTEFEKTAHDLDAQFTEKARKVAERFGEKVDEVFAPDNGQLAKELERLFSDGSAASVQNRVRELVGEALVKSREELVRQFSTADGTNPLADFKAATIRELKQSRDGQEALVERLGELQRELQALRAEQEKLEELEEERERGTAKGRSYEEQVFEAIDALATPLGDDAEAVGDLKGATGKTGDVVVGIGASDGPPRGRIVFEAKDRRLSKPKALEELDRALAQRDADFAVLVVPSEEELPARIQPLREYNGDKLIVTHDPDEGSRLALEVGYRLARARVLMSRGSGDGIDAGALRDTLERARAGIDEVRNIKSNLTGATNHIDAARGLVESLADKVRGHLTEIERLVDAGAGSAAEDHQAELDV